MTETLNFNFFNQENTALLNNDNDPDVNFYNDITIDSNYFNVHDFPCHFNSF